MQRCGGGGTMPYLQKMKGLRRNRRCHERRSWYYNYLFKKKLLSKACNKLLLIPAEVSYGIGSCACPDEERSDGTRGRNHLIVRNIMELLPKRRKPAAQFEFLKTFVII